MDFRFGMLGDNVIDASSRVQSRTKGVAVEQIGVCRYQIIYKTSYDCRNFMWALHYCILFYTQPSLFRQYFLSFLTVFPCSSQFISK